MLKRNKVEYSNQQMAKMSWTGLTVSHIFPVYIVIILKGGTLLGENVELDTLKGTVNV